MDSAVANQVMEKKTYGKRVRGRSGRKGKKEPKQSNTAINRRNVPKGQRKKAAIAGAALPRGPVGWESRQYTATKYWKSPYQESTHQESNPVLYVPYDAAADIDHKERRRECSSDDQVSFSNAVVIGTATTEVEAGKSEEIELGAVVTTTANPMFADMWELVPFPKTDEKPLPKPKSLGYVVVDPTDIPDTHALSVDPVDDDTASSADEPWELLTVPSM